MPTWLLNYLLPIFISAFMPVAIEYVKKAAEYLRGRLPASVTLMLATVISESSNLAQAQLTGTALPPGVTTLIAVLLNELGSDLGAQPPTPGVS
jgi:hypothetical protein